MIVPFKYYQNILDPILPNTKELFVSYILNAMSLNKKLENAFFDPVFLYKVFVLM